MIRDEAHPHTYSLSLEARCIFDNFHLSGVLLLIKHEDKHASFVLKVRVLLAKTHWFLLQETARFLKLNTLVQEALDRLLCIELYKWVLQPIHEA